MNRSFNPLIVIALLLLFCSFLFPPNFLTTSVSDTLTQSVWTEMESWKDEDGDGIFTLETDSCQADNNWLFRPDSTFEMTEDVIICEPDMPYLDTVSCHWLLKSNETILSLITEEDDRDFQIYAIGQHEVILHAIDPVNSAAPAWEKIVLRRQ